MLPMHSCRICLGEDIEKRLIAPCNCDGSMRFVHRRCLDDWYKHNLKETCEICGEDYARSKKSSFSPKITVRNFDEVRYVYQWLLFAFLISWLFSCILFTVYSMDAAWIYVNWVGLFLILAAMMVTFKISCFEKRFTNKDMDVRTILVI